MPKHSNYNDRFLACLKLFDETMNVLDATRMVGLSNNVYWKASMMSYVNRFKKLCSAIASEQVEAMNYANKLSEERQIKAAEKREKDRAKQDKKRQEQKAEPPAATPDAAKAAEKKPDVPAVKSESEKAADKKPAAKKPEETDPAPELEKVEQPKKKRTTKKEKGTESENN